ncbi:sodium:solute symporter [Acidobacteriota bacterium]
MQGMQTLDWIIIVIYFIVLLGIAWWVTRQKQDSPTDYFLAGRHVGWFVIGASIFASNIGSEHIVGLAGTAAKSGVAMGHYELHAWCILLLGWVFVPFYMRSRVFTMPEFLEKRYSPTARWILSIISLVAYILTKVSVTVYAGAVVFQALMGIDFWTGALVTVIFTGIYTVMGGLKAVVYTETLQAIVLLIGSITVTILGLVKIGGFGKLVSIVGTQHFNLFLPMNHPDFPWLGMVLAPPIVGIWYWCTDQCIVQRTLAAQGETQARRGTIFASFLKLFPFFIFFIPGITAYALSKTGQLQLAASDQAFPMLVKLLLPVGLRGLVVGGLLAALMSSLAAVFNSCSTLFTMDIYKKIRPDATEKRLVHVGRVATGIVVVSGILWIPFMKFISGELYHYLQSVQAYLAPPIAAVFLLGIFWKRINARGAHAALIGGFAIGILRLVAELNKKHLSGFLHTFADINFLYFCVYLFLVCIALMISFSMFSREPAYEKINGLTYGTTMAEDKKASRDSWSKGDLILSFVVLAIIALILICFSPLVIAQ